MRITSASKRPIQDIRDDIARRKREYNEARDRVQKADEESSRAFRRATQEVIQPVIDELNAAFEQWETIHPEITADIGWGDGYEISIRCDRGKNANNALQWTYDVKLNDDGSVRAKTSSWSGLDGTTEAQLHSLEQVIAALRYLNSLDWATLLNKQVPDYNDFRHNLTKPPFENFDQELADAELADCIGENKLIRVKPWGETCPYRNELYIRIIRETPSQYVINIVPTYAALSNNRSDIDKYLGDDKYDTYRVRKTSIKPVFPIDTIDL